jgi:hypothetical protein
VTDSAHRKNDGDRPAIEKEENTKTHQPFQSNASSTKVKVEVVEGIP